MLVGLDSRTSRSVGASETGDKKNMQSTTTKTEIKMNLVRFVRFRTGLLFPAERNTLLAPAHSIDGDQVLGVGRQARQREVAPGGRQPLVLGPAAADHLVADAVAADFALRGKPVDGEGVGEDLGEAQGDW